MLNLMIKILFFFKNKLKNCVYLDSDIQYAGMTHLSEHVKLAELDTQQVIVKSYGQHTYLEAGWNLLNLNLMQTHHFCLKFYS